MTKQERAHQETEFMNQFLERSRSINASSTACLLGLVLALFVVGVSRAAVPDSERQFLLDIYNDMHHENWGSSDGWNGPPGTECTWYGITCDSTGDHVIAVEMEWNGMYGLLPASLSDQSQLQVFDLRLNAFTGEVPPLNRMTALRIFDLEQFIGSTTGLTGNLPPIGGLTNLTRFNVAWHQLSGPLPSFTAADRLDSLSEFIVNDNHFGGSVPDLSHLPSISTFVIYENQLSGHLPPLNMLQTLVIFDATSNQLTGAIPEIAGLQQLQQFAVGGNQLDTINSSFADLPQLTEYYAEENALHGSIEHLDGAPNLEVFLVYDNQLAGPLPDLGQNLHLRNFNLDDNSLSGPLPSISNLAELEYFYVADNAFTGSIPELGALASLKAFVANNNQLTGSIPAIALIPTFNTLNLENNQLTGTLPRLGTLNLMYLLVAGNELSGNIPAAPPAALKAGSLCPNHFEPFESPRWDGATGQSPWYQNCTPVPDSVFANGFE